MRIKKKWNVLLDRLFSEVGPWLSRHIYLSILGLIGLGVAILFAVVSYVYVRVESLEKQLSSHRWNIPSTVYADAPLLSAGMRVDQNWLRSYLNRLDYQKTAGPHVKSAQYVLSTNHISFRARKLFDSDVEPEPVSIAFGSGYIQQIINLRTRKSMESCALEPTPISDFFGPDWQKRSLVSFDDIPHHLIEAVIAIEDRRFYQHPGVDLLAVFRALLHNMTGDKKIQGGSTITQQLVKNFYLSKERTLRRKASEALMAILLERRLSKEKILEFYLNEIYLGQQGAISIHGVAEGSRLYFGKDVKYVNVPEAALLAAMIQAPQRYNPYRNPERAKDRRDTVLAAMRNIGAITQNQYEMYRDQPIVLNGYDPRNNEAPYFIDLLDRQLSGDYSSSDIQNRNYRIFTTLDLDMQRAAEETLREGLARIDRLQYRKKKKNSQGCLIAVDPATGAIKAFVGGRNYSKSQFDRLSQAARQPGSSFKPFVYAAALENAFTSQEPVFTPATLIADEPWSLSLSNAVWTPRNYDGSYHGVVSSRIALAESMNVATAKLAYEIGLHKIAALAKNLGLKSVKPYPSLALGAFEATPLELIKAYTAFINGGKTVDLTGIKRMTDVNGTSLKEHQLRSVRVLHPETAYLITNMLRSVMAFGTGASYHRWRIQHPVAGKTGTTNDYKDAWFIGYTPNLICLVWVGYDDNTPIGMTGGKAALPIWATFMQKALRSIPVQDFQRPPGIVTQLIDPTTGKLATESCAYSIQEIFIQGTEPFELCNEQYHLLPVQYFAFPNTGYNDPATRYTGDLEDSNNFFPEPPVYLEDSQVSNDATYYAAPQKATGRVFTNEAIEDRNGAEQKD